MTDLEKFLSECERLDKQATKGPWATGPQNGNYGHNVLSYLGCKTIFSTPQIKTQSGHDETSANADFAAYSRTALPLLVKILREILATGGKPVSKDYMVWIAERALKETLHA